MQGLPWIADDQKEVLGPGDTLYGNHDNLLEVFIASDFATASPGLEDEHANAEEPPSYPLHERPTTPKLELPPETLPLVLESQPNDSEEGTRFKHRCPKCHERFRTPGLQRYTCLTHLRLAP